MGVLLAFFLFGVLYTFFGIATIGNPERLRAFLHSITDGGPAKFLLGFLACLLGGALILHFGMFGPGFAAVISVMGWLGLVKGLMLMLAPSTMDRLLEPIADNRVFAAAVSVISLVFGITLIALSIIL